MKERRFVKVALIVLMLLLSIDLGSRFFFSPKEVAAAGKAQYKVVMLEDQRAATLEKMLNSMAEQGWEFDEMALPYVIFKK